MVKISLYISALLCLTLLSFECGKTCAEVSYSFSMAEQFYPELDSIKIGDTLWAVSSHSTTFRDTGTGNNIDYSSSVLGSNIRLLNYTDSAIIASGNIGAFHSFTTLVVEGSEVGNDNLPDENKGVNYEEENDSFLLRIAFIPKEKGIYGISLGNAGAVRHNHGCELAAVELENANANNHLYLYQNSRPGYQISSYERTHLYCFKVY